MKPFYKYHGAGNDFIIFNSLKEDIELTESQIKHLCNRHKGIGADGLMLLLKSEKFDFEMKYYNSNGKEGSMCGNGGRCIISFAYDMGIKKERYSFLAVDGEHQGRILENQGSEKMIELQMSDVSEVQEVNGQYVIDTGSPHYLDFQDQVERIDVFKEGKRIRNSDSFVKEGINVNFIQENKNKLFVRTYERGVENETLACGTGVTAAAMAASIRQGFKYQDFDIETLGGQLNVRFKTNDGTHFHQVFLSGPATFVFQGSIQK
ncbi:MAG: diaminopimelate epimerase [Bacteroidales bacterium]|nr:diaminopimelate epimerase [Bacteroidales bacterium]